MKFAKIAFAVMALSSASLALAEVDPAEVIAPLTNITDVTTEVTTALNPDSDEFTFTEGSNVALIGQSSENNIAYTVQETTGNFAAVLQAGSDAPGVAYINQTAAGNRAIISQK
jgi:hypothetical protein